MGDPFPTRLRWWSMGQHIGDKQHLGSDERGNALPEFVIAVTPLLAMFFGFSQAGYAMTGHLLMHHAAIVAARCASVVKGPNLPGTYVSNQDGKSDNGDAPDECTKAATAALGPMAHLFTGIAVIPTYVGGDPYGDVDVTTIATFQCGVPLGKHLVCGPSTSLNFSFEIKLPHQGAEYALEDSNCGGSCDSPKGSSGEGGGTGEAPGAGGNGGTGGPAGTGSGGFVGGGGGFGGGGAGGSF